MAVLVTGGAGFIGSHLSERLVALGYEVVCVDDFNDYYDPQLKRQNLRQVSNSPRFHLEALDIVDTHSLATVFSRYPIESVIHIAARAGVRPSLLDPLLYERVNVQGTMGLLELSRQHRVGRFLFASSSSVYGAASEVPFREDDPAARPISPYAATKRSGELICYTYHHLYALPITCLRLFTVYGPRQRPDLAINSFMRSVLDGRKITLYGDGTSARDYTYVGDVVEAFVAAQTRDVPLEYEILNIGNSSPITLVRLIDLIEQATGRQAQVRYAPMQPGDVPRTYASIENAERLLGWRPRTPIEEGLRRFAEWLRNQEEPSFSTSPG
jgi:UDP-glucuronate 4-epimerase